MFVTIIDDLEGFQMCVAESVIELEDFDDLYVREAFDTLKGVLGKQYDGDLQGFMLVAPRYWAKLEKSLINNNIAQAVQAAESFAVCAEDIGLELFAYYCLNIAQIIREGKGENLEEIKKQLEYLFAYFLQISSDIKAHLARKAIYCIDGKLKD